MPACCGLRVPHCARPAPCTPKTLPGSPLSSMRGILTACPPHRSVLPPRVSEVIGVMHMKCYVFDDTGGRCFTYWRARVLAGASPPMPGHLPCIGYSHACAGCILNISSTGAAVTKDVAVPCLYDGL